jgi:hypothetical protein
MHLFNVRQKRYGVEKHYVKLRQLSVDGTQRKLHKSSRLFARTEDKTIIHDERQIKQNYIHKEINSTLNGAMLDTIRLKIACLPI